MSLLEDGSLAEVLHEIDEREKGVVHTVTVSNPSKLNVLNSPMMVTLRKTLEHCAADPRARVVVLKGAGHDAWIGGADVREMAGLDPDGAEAFIRTLQGVCQCIRRLPIPVVAVIRGYCLGAGLEVAACCDLRLACQDSSFGMPEVKVGLPSVIEAAILPRLIGIGRTRDLVLTGRLIDARVAWRWGLLDGLVPEPALDALAASRVDDLLEAAPNALRLQKRLCRIWEEHSLTDSINAGITAFRRAYETDEPQTYMARFLRRDDGRDD
jgi:enoyl-CoA hydratase/carnithine racemase